MKKDYPSNIILLDTTLEVLRENHPDEVVLKNLVAEVENRTNALLDDPLFKDAKYLGHTGTISEVYSVIGHLIKEGEIDDSQMEFGGGLKISVDGLNKLDLGGYKKRYDSAKSNLDMQISAPKRVKRAFWMSVVAIVISIVAILVSWFK